MGFIKAAIDSVGGTLADQWQDFYTVPQDITPTSAFFPAVKLEQNNGRGANTKGSSNVISNGSRIVVPEGYGLITLDSGRATGLVAEPGAFTFYSDAQDAKSVFAGDGILSSTLKTSWQRFKFGGVPSSQQAAFFVALKELPNNRFGTQSEIYWDDAYIGAQVGALARGSYTVRITDPVLFLRSFVAASFLNPGGGYFDFTDESNPASAQLFNEVVSSLASSFSRYSNDPSSAGSNRIARLQSDSSGLARAMSTTLEEEYHWRTGRGITIERVNIQAIEYDADTKQILSDVKKADALSGHRGNSFLQQSLARGVQGAGENGGGAGLVGFGMGVPMAGASLAGIPQQNNVTPAAAGIGYGLPSQTQQPHEPVQPAHSVPVQKNQPVSPVEKLKEMKELLDLGIVSPEEFAQVKKDLLGF